MLNGSLDCEILVRRPTLYALMTIRSTLCDEDWLTAAPGRRGYKNDVVAAVCLI